MLRTNSLPANICSSVHLILLFFLCTCFSGQPSDYNGFLGSSSRASSRASSARASPVVSFPFLSLTKLQYCSFKVEPVISVTHEDQWHKLTCYPAPLHSLFLTLEYSVSGGISMNLVCVVLPLVNKAWNVSIDAPILMHNCLN